MSLTKEMIIKIEEEVQSYTDEQLLDYHYSYSSLNKHYSNSFYAFRITKSLEEINRRGLDANKFMKDMNSRITS